MMQSASHAQSSIHPLQCVENALESHIQCDYEPLGIDNALGTGDLHFLKITKQGTCLSSTDMKMPSQLLDRVCMCRLHITLHCVVHHIHPYVSQLWLSHFP